MRRVFVRSLEEIEDGKNLPKLPGLYLAWIWNLLFWIFSKSHSYCLIPSLNSSPALGELYASGKNHPQKLLIIAPDPFFSIGLAAQMAPKQKSRTTKRFCLIITSR